MQSVAGSNKNLECADCKTNFTSASLLLKHFAEHIIEQVSETELSFNNESTNSASHKKIKHSSLQTKKKERKESILETVLRQSVVQSKMMEKLSQLNSHQNDITCNSNTSSSSSDSFKSSSSHFVTNNFGETADKVALPDMVVEIGQRAKEKHRYPNEMSLVKFDLQKRLENCVSRLALKQGQKETDMSTNSPMSSKQIKPSHFKDEIAESAEKKVTKNCDGEEFSPLKLCIVTLDDNESKEESDASIANMVKEQCASKSLKGASSRKQLMPKKIHRPNNNVNTQLKPHFFSDSKICQKTSAKKKYLCHVCSKSFGWSTDLKRHLLTHTGERPFKCQLCDATFTRNFLLQKHESRVHVIDNVDKVPKEEVKKYIMTSSNNNIIINNNNNNNVEITTIEKHSVLSGKNHKSKVWKHSLLSDKAKNSLNLKFDKMEEVCDKFAPAKRKLQCDETSFDHFSQKVFNIL